MDKTNSIKNSLKATISAAIKTGDEALILQARRVMSTYLRGGTYDATTQQVIPAGLGITGLRY